METGKVPIEVYLHTSYEPDAEYVDGEIEERPAEGYDHGDWQQAVAAWFFEHAKEWQIKALPSLRVQVAPTRIRVPDVVVIGSQNPREQIITIPPIAVFEIIGVEDRFARMMHKMSDYSAMGIPQIWYVTPNDGACFRYVNGCISRQERFVEEVIDFPVSSFATLRQH